jgi:hypothetical protein
MAAPGSRYCINTVFRMVPVSEGEVFNAVASAVPLSTFVATLVTCIDTCCIARTETGIAYHGSFALAVGEAAPAARPGNTSQDASATTRNRPAVILGRRFLIIYSPTNSCKTSPRWSWSRAPVAAGTARSSWDWYHLCEPCHPN